jgi:hypothetical protein
MSVVGFAVESLQAVQRLQSGRIEHIFIAISGTLYLKENGGKVIFWTNSAPPRAEALLGEVVSAFRQFHSDVQRVIEARVPSMRNHPCWNRWFLRGRNLCGTPPRRSDFGDLASSAGHP